MWQSERQSDARAIDHLPDYVAADRAILDLIQDHENGGVYLNRLCPLLRIRTLIKQTRLAPVRIDSKSSLFRN